jgi:methylenetetrahydrofolate dehydrogenase (NADP+)/methenyltetrahydrofolate cyclohydrolase
MMNLLINANATVTLCHSKTKDLAKVTKKADVLVVAIGKKHFITRDMVKRGAVVIDVGINRIDGKLYGDVNYDDVYDKVKKITPVPGGVGPMTVVMLMKNCIEAYEKQNS